MPKETLQFRCQVCGHHSPVEALAIQHKGFTIFRRTLGGKVARSDAEKILLKGIKTGRGSAHGRLGYRELDGFATEVYLDQYIRALEVALESAKKQKQEVEKK